MLFGSVSFVQYWFMFQSMHESLYFIIAQVSIQMRHIDLLNKTWLDNLWWIMEMLFLGESMWGPCFKHGLTLNPAWISNYNGSKVWDEISYPFPNFNGAAVEVWKWNSNFIPQLTGYVITYRCWASRVTFNLRCLDVHMTSLQWCTCGEMEAHVQMTALFFLVWKYTQYHLLFTKCYSLDINFSCIFWKTVFAILIEIQLKYVQQFWPNSMKPYGITKLQWVNGIVNKIFNWMINTYWFPQQH